MGSLGFKLSYIPPTTLVALVIIPNAAIEFLEMKTYSVCQKASATELKVQILSEIEKKNFV